MCALILVIHSLGIFLRRSLTRFVMNTNCGLMLLGFFVCLQGGGDPPENRIEKREVGNIELELFRNSSSMSQVVAINSHESIVGTREILEESGASLRSVPFYAGIHGMKDIPVPAGFTNLEVVAISDNDLVIGYATRIRKNPDGALRGVVWNSNSDQFSFLPRGDGDDVNHAQDISADGKRITGYTTGPNRLRPALWKRDESSGEWLITVLSSEYDDNPFLMSGQLRISPNGKWIAGCCTEDFRPDGTIDSALFLWKENESGEWERTKLSSQEIYLRGINDLGEMAGSIPGPKGERRPCFVAPSGGLVLLGLLPNDVSGQANDINNSSVIVGFSDDPIGGEGGPEPCVWSKDGKAKRFANSGILYGTILGVNDSGQMVGAIEVSPDISSSDVTTTADEDLLLGFRTVK